MRAISSTAKLYLVASAVVLPAPYLIPLDLLSPPTPDRMVVWPMVAFGSAPLAVVGSLLASLHQRHALTTSWARFAAWAWGVAAVLTFVPLVYWLPRSSSNLIAGGLGAGSAFVAAIAFVGLARELWQRRLPGRWWVLVACLQVALLFGTVAVNRSSQFFAPSGGLDQVVETLTPFALDCALLAAVLIAAHVVAWGRGASATAG